MLALRWMATALFVVAVPVFLLLTNVRVAAMEPRVSGYAFDRYDAVQRTGVERAELDRAARDIARYFRDDEPLLTTRVVVDGREQALFSPREVLHMRDVKQLFRAVFRLHEIAFVYIVAYVAAVVLWSRERSMRRLAGQCVAAGAATAGLLGTGAVAVLVGFDTLFRGFHLLSFANDFWLLDPRRDRLVQMFPQGFWFDVTLAVGVLTLLEGAALALLAYGYLRWLDHRAGRQRPAPELAEPAASEGG